MLSLELHKTCWNHKSHFRQNHPYCIYPCISQTHVWVNPPFQGQRLDFSSFLVKEKFRLIESFQVFDLLFLRMYWKHGELKKNCSVKFRNTCLYHHNSWFKHIWALPFTGEVIYTIHYYILALFDVSFKQLATHNAQIKLLLVAGSLTLSGGKVTGNHLHMWK